MGLGDRLRGNHELERILVMIAGQPTGHAAEGPSRSRIPGIEKIVKIGDNMRGFRQAPAADFRRHLPRRRRTDEYVMGCINDGGASFGPQPGVID